MTAIQASNISDYLPAIAGRDEFVVAKKPGGYTVINYNVMMGDTFPDPDTASTEEERRLFMLRRDCRGIKFSTEYGNIICRPFHKFFNVNERPETMLNKLDFSKPHWILEKLDGSMIAPFMAVTGNIYGPRWGTKMGINDISLPVEEFVATRPEYEKLANFCLNGDATPIFEWCSRQNTIVIDHPVDRLVLTAIRHNFTGEYCTYDQLTEIAESFGVEVVKAYEGNADSMVALVEETKGLVGMEGFVVVFNTGLMVKVKAEDYLRKHKSKEAVQLEKNIIELLVTDKLDDVKSFLSETDLARVEQFEIEFWLGVRDNALILQALFDVAKVGGLTAERRAFATEFVAKQPAIYRPMLFRMLDGAQAFDLIRGAIAKSCSTSTKVEEVRSLFGGIFWTKISIEE